jgi:hypothetical protein
MMRWTRTNLLLALCLCLGAPPVLADLLPSPPQGAGTVIARSGYDYGPSVIEDGGIQRFWWCGLSNGTDHILYQSYNPSTRTWSPSQPVSVLAPVAGSSWEGRFVCDPSVVRGQFTYLGRSYAYALYYTATSDDTGGGIGNRIGVAFSNDGINWTRYAGNPIIRPSSMDGTYGAGQSAVWNRDGRSSITLFYTDTSGKGLFTASSADGITFGAPTKLSTATTEGGHLLRWNSDFAIDSTTGLLYAAVPGYFRRATRAGEHSETYEIGLYRLPYAQALAGTGTWEFLANIDTNLTGHALNFAPGFRRNGYGDLSGIIGHAGVTVYFGGGAMSDPSWDIRWVSWWPGTTTLPLNRYASYTTQRHWVTSGYVPADYRAPSQGGSGRLDLTLGHIDLAPGPGKVRLRGCQVVSGGVLTSDRFLSLDSGCEGHHLLGTNGWLFQSPPAGVAVKPLYRCNTGTGHFASNLSNCEGNTVEGLLGYLRAQP